MSGSISVPVEYIITTKSDWAVLQITEGGWWTDLEIKCTEGCDKLVSGIQQGQNVIGISKRPFDNTTVVIHAWCNLNIKREYSSSFITYLVTRGDIESMMVQVIAGKESHTLVHDRKIPNDSRNPFQFNVPVQRYLDSLEQKRATKGVQEQPKVRIEAQQETQHVIITAFNEMFKRIFEKKEPTEGDVTEVFQYLRSNSKNSTKFLDAETCRDLTLQTQTRLCRFPNLKKKVSSEADKTLEEIRKRYDELRKIEGKISVQAIGLGGIEKGEKRVTPQE